LRRAQWHVRLLWDYLAATASVLLRFIVAVFRDPEQLKELEMLRCEYALAVSRASGPTEKLRALSYGGRTQPVYWTAAPASLRQGEWRIPSI